MSFKTSSLASLSSLITKGTTPTTLGYAHSDSGIPFLRVQNIFSGQVNFKEDTLFIDSNTHTALKRSQIQGGDVLVTIAGTIGRTGVVPHDAPEMNCNQAVAIVRPTPEIERSYLRHWLESQEARSQMLGSTVTGTISNLSLSQLGELRVPLPPLEEQRRIAAILDQAETLRIQRRTALALLDSLTQSLFLDMFGDPVANPKGWPTESLTDLCHCYSGGTPSKAKKEYWEGELPWFSAKDMKAEDLFDSEDHISEQVPETTTLKLLPKDTVAIVVRGMILAHTFPVCVLRIPATINQDLKALLPKQPVNSQFLAACLRSQSGFVLEKVSEAGHGTKRLDAQGLQSIRIPRPGDALEQTFATRIASIEALKTTHRRALAALDALFASLQQRAFAGQL